MRFAVGDPVPWFRADTHTTRDFNFSAAAGRYVVLTFLGSAQYAAARQVVADVLAAGGEFNDERACFFGVSVDAQDFTQQRLQERLPGIRFFQDSAGTVSRQFGALSGDSSSGVSNYQPFTLVLDERLRTLARIPLTETGTGHIAQALAIVRSMPDLGSSKVADVQAPVLIVPRVFEPEFCRRLIELYQQHGGEESGFMRDEEGRTVGIYDHSHKRRQDYIITDEAVRKQCMFRIHDRLAPEIERAYQFRATRMERYIVACYEGEKGGHFRAHRDNTTRGTAHRRFAVTLNLNSDEYDGGYLCFTEYGRQLFKPPTGGACVFSCSLLHEATPVTRGVRYVFLPFLYDDAAAKIREENARFLAGDKNSPAGAGAPASIGVDNL